MPHQQTAHTSFRYFIDFFDEFQTISRQVFTLNFWIDPLGLEARKTIKSRIWMGLITSINKLTKSNYKSLKIYLGWTAYSNIMAKMEI